MPVMRGACAAGSSIFASRHSSFGQVRPLQVFAGQRPITLTSPSSPAHQNQGAFLRRRLPGSSVIRPCPTPAGVPSKPALRPLPSCQTGLPRFPHHPSGVPCALPRRIERVRASIASPSMLPSPFCRRVGIRISTFEACSGFTRVRPVGLLNRPRRPSSRGSSPACCRSRPLVSYQSNRQFSGWCLPPLVIRAFGAHCQNRERATQKTLNSGGS